MTESKGGLLVLKPYYDFRTRLLAALKADLIGPASEDEEIPDPPITRYVTGILYPQSSGSIDPAHDLDLGEEDDVTGVPDPPVAMANVRYPSSMGMTFAVNQREADYISVAIEAGRYHLSTPRESKGSSRHSTSGTEVWRREAVRPDPKRISISRAIPSDRASVIDGLALYWRVRAADADGTVPVTLVLLNARKVPRGELRDADAFFQVRMSVTAEGRRNAFVERRVSAAASSDEDLQLYRLLYRNARSFATGHGCSVEWVTESGRPERASLIRTAYVPTAEVPLIENNPNISGRILEFKFLSAAEKPDILMELRHFCEGYREWIELLEEDVGSLDPELRGIGASQGLLCRESLGRMERGISILDRDQDAWDAFRLMNRAMLQQRARVEWERDGRPPGGPIEKSSLAWRPFQLAFFLLCAEGIVDTGSPSRRIVDLLWFPTGGGKTEAYLGLIAFTIFLRRLRNGARGAGVTALMRYTLRLLTIQQFERATLLICCCEALRREDLRRLGNEPVSVGLWVGQDGTPNTRRDAQLSLNKIRSGVSVEKGNPMQIQSCPWCGAPLDHTKYTLSSSRLLIACGQDGCLFSQGLPAYVVDQDIYDYRPTLLIATVDKFAGLPWRSEISNLFNGLRGDYLTPELIIQDELHLISGPLGTLTGLYETAVDFLSTREGVGPKVIASTATIRRAGSQTQGLFDRDVRQFPQAGIDARDSYYAQEANREDRGDRLFVGVMAAGTSQTTLLIRAYANLLQNTAQILAPPNVKDPYWTLVGYFNSLRVLGGARMQVQDDVNDRIQLLSRSSHETPRSIENRIELTSREPSANIPHHLEAMKDSLPSANALDVILATNMISVGVDINRLGLMVVMGQPPSTSEYIQSTSRVGRRFPGLIVVLFNAAKSRDRSHYESFLAYHSALYRQVESSSVTPFSSRARDRGLHSIFVALARHLIPDLNPNSGAARVEQYLSELNEIRDIILKRVSRIAPEEYQATATELEKVLEHWRDAARSNPNLVFRDDDHHEKALLVDASVDEVDAGSSLPTLWSLRDVDRSSGVHRVA